AAGTQVPADLNGRRLLNILFKPGVTDNVGATAARALTDLGLDVERVATCRKYWINADAADEDIARLAARVLSNDSIERIISGPLPLETIALGSDYQFALRRIPLLQMDDEALSRLSREGQLYLSL